MENATKEVQSCEEKLRRAMIESDTQTLETLLHDKLLFLSPTGDIITKSMDIEAYATKIMIVEDILSSDQKINIIKDNAVVSVTVQLQGYFMEQPIKGTFKYIRIWKKCDSQWKIIGGGGTAVSA